ncbi:hypothetical protein VPH35_042580 [Triticum aestivum]
MRIEEQTSWIVISRQAKAHLDLIWPDNTAHTDASVPTCSWPRPTREKLGLARPLPPPPPPHCPADAAAPVDHIPSFDGFRSSVRSCGRPPLFRTSTPPPSCRLRQRPPLPPHRQV